MNKKHDTREAARKELHEAGYRVGFSSPGRPELWVKDKSRMAIARCVILADEQWVIMTYPEPSNATPAQVAELTKRDGIPLANGKAPLDAVPEVLCTDVTDLL